MHRSPVCRDYCLRSVLKVGVAKAYYGALATRRVMSVVSSLTIAQPQLSQRQTGKLALVPSAV